MQGLGGVGRRGRRTAAALVVAFVLVAAASFAVVSCLRAPTPEVVVELGPIDLPAHAGHHDVSQPPLRAVTFPADGWLRGYAIDVVDAAGRPVPQQVLHHVNLIAPERRELFSPIMLRLGAAGPETGPVTLPPVIGVPVHRGDSLLVTAMLHNPTGNAYAGVRLRIHLPYVPQDRRVGVLAAAPFYVDVMPPAGDHDFDLPPGRSERFWEGRPAVAARVLGVGGHLHRYGVALRFEDRTARQVLWETTPRTDGAGEVTAIPRKLFLWPPGVTLDPAHVYRLTAVYDNPTGATIPRGGMGTLGGVVLPADAARWPTVVRQDPQYREDVAVTRRTNAMSDAMQDAMHDGHGAEHDH